MPKTLADITTSLDTVHGGRGAGRAIAGAVRGAGTALEKIGGWAGGAMAIKEGWDYLRGNTSGGDRSSTPAAQPPASQE